MRTSITVSCLVNKNASGEFLWTPTRSKRPVDPDGTRTHNLCQSTRRMLPPPPESNALPLGHGTTLLIDLSGISSIYPK